MANKFLIVCGGSGVGLLGQRHILGIDGEIHIDVQKEQSEERVRKDPYNRSLNVRIDQGEEMAAAAVLLGEMRGWMSRFPKNSPEANYLQLLCDETLAAKQLSEGLGQMPALGGGAIRTSTVSRALDNAIRQMTNVWTGGLGTGESIQVWIVSSACGGTGAGIQRYVAERIVNSLRNVRGVRIDLRFIRIGGLTYQVFGAERINLNTFMSVAADLAFREILSRKPEYVEKRVGVTCTYFYVEVPAIGGGAGSKIPRAELVEMACKAIMDEEMQKKLQSIQNNADSIAVVRVGYWKKDFDDRVRIAEALKDLNEKLQELLRPKPDWVGKEKSQPQFQITFDDLVRKNLGADPLALRIADGWSFVKFEERDLTLSASELVKRWKNSLATCLGKEVDSIERNLRVPPVGGGPAEELKPVVLPPRYGSNWFESVRRAQQVAAWADHRKKELEPLLRKQAAELSNISNSRANAQEKATKMASEMETFTTNLVEYLEWDTWSQKETNFLGSEFQPVNRLQKQLQELQKEYPVAGEVPVKAVELDDTISGQGGKLWLSLLIKAQENNDRDLLLKRVLQGATKLTRLGLTSLLDLRDSEPIEKIQEELQEAGKIVLQGKEHRAQWWQGREPTPDVEGGGMLDKYRILPFLTQDARVELGEADATNQVKYTYAGVGMLGLTILAFDAATLAVPNKPATSAKYLLTPFTSYASERLAEGQYLELVQAGVVGEPLYRPVLEELFKPSEVSQLAKYFPLYGKSVAKQAKKGKAKRK